MSEPALAPAPQNPLLSAAAVDSLRPSSLGPGLAVDAYQGIAGAMKLTVRLGDQIIDPVAREERTNASDAALEATTETDMSGSAPPPANGTAAATGRRGA